MLEHVFIELLQVSLGRKDKLSHTPSAFEWDILYNMCLKQTVAGVVFESLESLNKYGQKPPLQVLYEWIGLSEEIKSNNIKLNKRCGELTMSLKEAGFECCILKGQGNSVLYKHPLSRVAGDIDAWVNGSSISIREFVHSRFPKAEECVLHIDFPIYEDVSVELHYQPSFMRNPKHYKRLSDYYQEVSYQQFHNFMPIEGSDFLVSFPTVEFNLIHQMAHILKHFIYGGVGLRQIMDYYYLLLKNEGKGEKSGWEKMFEQMGLLNIGMAVMWILRNIFLLEETNLIVNIDEKRGKLLWKEIMRCGNMGKYDERNRKKWSPFTYQLNRCFSLMWYFPEETIVAPILGKIHRSFIKA